MELEGIYRKSGGAKQMRQIQQLFDQNQIPNLADDKQWNDISAVAGVLKQYFRDLPDPLFTFQFHNDFIKATGKLSMYLVKKKEIYLKALKISTTQARGLRKYKESYTSCHPRIGIQFNI